MPRTRGVDRRGQIPDMLSIHVRPPEIADRQFPGHWEGYLIKGEGQAHATATYEHELLAGALTKKQMLPYRATIRARDLAEFNGWVRHEGEEFLYVLTGVIRLYTEFYEPVDLRRGDSAYYDASMGHNVISLSEEDATILWVTSLA